MTVSLKKLSNISIAFINPQHADWSLANNMTYLMCQSYYNHYGKYSNNVTWLPAPYKWNLYASFEDSLSGLELADAFMFSSYAWNYSICDQLAKYIKETWPEKICILGGPHIGTNEPEFLVSRNHYDFICQPTKPGEIFIEDFINSFIENNGKPIATEIAWELRSNKGRIHNISEESYSVYEEHIDYLTEILEFARVSKCEPFIVIETTRGCPYKCVYCEWGGGIGTKIYKKDIDIVKRDIVAMKKAGYRDAYLTDANFGVFKERDVEIFKFGYENNFNLTDISTMKSKDLNRRIDLIDEWFNIVGKGFETHSPSYRGTDMWGETEFVSVLPTVSIQSVSEEAMKIANRIDLSSEDKIKLGLHIRKKCSEQGYPAPALELILAMPGSTVDDFYREMELMWNFKAFSTFDLDGWANFRHDYMFLPDSVLNSPEYKAKYNIETVEVFSDIVDEDGIDNWDSLYKNKRTYFKTIRSCYSFTVDEMIQMWIMNQASPWFLKNIYQHIEDEIDAKTFGKICWDVFTQLEEFKYIWDDVYDIFNPETPPRSIRKLKVPPYGEDAHQAFRVEVIEKLLNDNEIRIKSEIIYRCLMKDAA